MKIASLIARILLGLLFLVIGLNGLVPFLPTGPTPSGLAGQFLAALEQSHYALVVSALQLVGGILLLINRYVPLGLTVLGPVIVNIVLFHLFLFRAGLPLAIVVAILWGIVVFRNRRHFSGLFVQRTD
jgi:putative oxidoreductase